MQSGVFLPFAAASPPLPGGGAAAPGKGVSYGGGGVVCRGTETAGETAEKAVIPVFSGGRGVSFLLPDFLWGWLDVSGLFGEYSVSGGAGEN